jgi:phosphopantothenoylcysteine decarboxylase/phosphopantothenate--cysteine ligase
MSAFRVLITGGGCVEKIDDVRAITNTSSGKTALLIARVIKALNPAAAVTYLMAERAVQPKLEGKAKTAGGKAETVCKTKTAGAAARDSVKNFNSCADLQKLLRAELSANKYDLIFHAAAVSDYSVQSLVVDGKEFKPGRVSKISGAKNVSVNLKLNPKLLAEIPALAKKKNKSAVVVGFKLTSNASEAEREKAVQKLFAENNPPDFVISNDLSEITPKSHPCVLWRAGDKTQSACKAKKGGAAASGAVIVARGQIQTIVRKIYAFNS